MGTRHTQTVINKEGAVKVAQYGQWDGYPKEQGRSILGFLRNNDIEKYCNEVNKLHAITKEEIEIVESDPIWETNYPFLSRDCGSKIHKMIYEGKVPFVSLFEIDEMDFIEGEYIINFQTNTFTSIFKDIKNVYPLNELPTEEEYLSDFEK